MTGSGTDRTRPAAQAPAPVVILVEPQLAENIGMCARAMANFGLSQLRLVKPVQGWPNERAKVMAAGADRVLDAAVLYDSLADAIGEVWCREIDRAHAGVQTFERVGIRGW